MKRSCVSVIFVLVANACDLPLCTYDYDKPRMQCIGIIIQYMHVKLHVFPHACVTLSETHLSIITDCAFGCINSHAVPKMHGKHNLGKTLYCFKLSNIFTIQYTPAIDLSAFCAPI